MQLGASNSSDFFFQEDCTLSFVDPGGVNLPLQGDYDTVPGARYRITITAGSRDMSLTTLTVRPKWQFREFNHRVFIASEGHFLADAMIGKSGGRFVFYSPVVIHSNKSIQLWISLDYKSDLNIFFRHCEISISGLSENKNILDGATSMRLKFPGTNDSDPELFTMKKWISARYQNQPYSLTYDFPNNKFWRVTKAIDGKSYNLFYEDFGISSLGDNDNEMEITIVMLTVKETRDHLGLLGMVDTNNLTFRLHHSSNDAIALAVWKRNNAHCFAHSCVPIDVDEYPVYGHWAITDNIHYDDWVKLDRNIIYFICAMGNRIFATSCSGRLCSYNMVTKVWKDEREGAMNSVAGNEDGVYIMFSYVLNFSPERMKTQIMKMGPSDDTWVEVDTWVKEEGDSSSHIASLFVAGPNLYGVDDQGKAFQWNTTTSSWDDLNSNPVSMLMGCGSQLYALSADKQQVFVRNDGTHAYRGAPVMDPWLPIGDAMETLLSSDDDLYGVDKAGRLLRYHYDGRDVSWKVVCESSESGFWAGNGLVTKVSAKTDDMYVFYGNSWKRVDGFVESMVFGRTFLFGIRGTTPYYMPISALLVDKSVGRVVSHNRNLWLFTFATANERVPGYSGTVHVTVYDSIRGCQSDFTLSDVNFSFGGQSYTFEVELPANFITLTGMSMCSTFASSAIWLVNSVNEGLWHLSDVRAVSKRSSELISVAFDCKIAVVDDFTMLEIVAGRLKETAVGSNGNVSAEVILIDRVLRCSPRSAISSTSGARPSHVHFWRDYKNSSCPWQYVSITLSNGEYLSFKPENVGCSNYKSLAEDILVEKDKSPDMTFAIFLPNVTAAYNWCTTSLWDGHSKNSASFIKKIIEMGGGFTCLGKTIRDNHHVSEDSNWTVDRLLSIIIEIAVVSSD